MVEYAGECDYFGTLWVLLWCAVQQDMSLVRQVHVDAVGGDVVGHRQLVIPVVTHLLHNLQTTEKKKR